MSEKLLNNGKTLSEQFKKGWEDFMKIEESNEPTTSEVYQEDVKKCIETLIRCTHMVNILALFSSNEHISELPTDTIRFLLLPAFLGDLSLKVVSDNRKLQVDHAFVYFKSFLKHCHHYEISKDGRDLSQYIYEGELTEEQKSSSNSSREKTREEKIQMFKQSKDLQHKITIVQERISKDDSSVDENEMRDYHIDWLNLWINKTIENISSIKSEHEILDHMQKLREGKVKPEPPKERKPMKPILITREMIKNQVFGAGYRSLPTMTEDEYFEKEVREGKIVLDYDSKDKTKTTESNKEEEEDDDDDEEALRKRRAMDEWKDTHRRGEGNKDRHG